MELKTLIPDVSVDVLGLQGGGCKMDQSRKCYKSSKVGVGLYILPCRQVSAL